MCASVGVAIPGIQADGQITVGIPNIVLPFPAPVQPVAPPVAPAYPMPYAAPPQYVYVQPAPPPAPRQWCDYRARPRPVYPAGRLALDLRADGAVGAGPTGSHSLYGLGGAGVGLRYRALPHFGLELGFDVLGGRDYSDRKRLELAGTAGGLIYVNPRSRAQFYFSGGMMVDRAKATLGSATRTTTDFVQAEQHFTHLGGYGGIGLEMFATRHLAFHLDARGVLRQRVAGDGPEFTDPATGRTTNTSGGVVGSAGMLFYF
jgi:hypothetical protein